MFLIIIVIVVLQTDVVQPATCKKTLMLASCIVTVHVKHFYSCIYLYIYYGLASFDSSTVQDNIKANYDKLTKLPIELILERLLSKGIITPDEKKSIDNKPASQDKMSYFLESIITPSLSNDVTIKFKGFLEVLEESGDSTMIDLAKQLGTYVAM